MMSACARVALAVRVVALVRGEAGARADAAVGGGSVGAGGAAPVGATVGRRRGGRARDARLRRGDLRPVGVRAPVATGRGVVRGRRADARASRGGRGGGRARGMSTPTPAPASDPVLDSERPYSSRSDDAAEDRLVDEESSPCPRELIPCGSSRRLAARLERGGSASYVPRRIAPRDARRATAPARAQVARANNGSLREVLLVPGTIRRANVSVRAQKFAASRSRNKTPLLCGGAPHRRASSSRPSDSFAPVRGRVDVRWRVSPSYDNQY